MKRKIIRNVILFAVLSITGIIFIQLYWVKKAFNQQERLFNQRVHVSLTNVAEEILSLNNDSSELYEPVRQIGSNYFTVQINDTLHPYLLESLLKNEFLTRNIKLDFEYVIYDCFTDSIVYGKYVPMVNYNSKDREILPTGRKWDRDGHYFGVYFPTKNTYLANQMGIWIFSSAILLVVIAYFSYTTIVILKQKRLSEIKTDFINNITHELKTPISTISLSTEVLANEKNLEDKEKVKNYVRIIQEENRRLKTQVNQVLQVAALDKKEIHLEKKEIDIHKLIRQTLKSFELIIRSRSGKVLLDLNAENPCVMGDEFHFSNVFFNLLDNAIKYSSEEVIIRISSRNIKKGVCIVVSDNGIGISKKDQKYIFEKFYRVPTGNKHDVKGFGLGLFYVKTILQRHHGSIHLRSEPGKGSDFEIYIPHNH